MDKEDLEAFANNPDFIPGIYNYCDRWCERCPFTYRCLLFATEKRQFPDSESRDITNKKFWDKLSEMMRLSLEVLEEMAEEQGIDLDATDTGAVVREERKKRKEAENHAAAQRAKNYTEQTRLWFEKAEPLFKEKQEQLIQKARMELPGEDPSGDAVGIQDLVDVIRWYQNQIYVKIMRALHGRMDDDFPELDPVQNDHNGSAKVALIGIDRSIAAWCGLLQHFPEQEDAIFPLLVTLEQTRKLVEETFPKARAFKRPGFDTV